MVLKRWLIALLFFFPAFAIAQVEEAIEQWVEETDDNEAAADFHDLMLQLRSHPIPDTGIEELHYPARAAVQSQGTTVCPLLRQQYHSLAGRNHCHPAL